MSIEETVQKVPTKRIDARDGMAVTAAIWEEAHNYHRRHQSLHGLLAHGPGILTGLEVIASDPADTSVYIRPGVAIAPGGETVIIAEPYRYPFGNTIDGLLHILLNYGEGRPQPANQQDGAEGLHYIHEHYGIEVQQTLPAGPYLELARVRRDSRQAPIANAGAFDRPGPNEIDLRFRRQASLSAVENVSIGVAYADDGRNSGPARNTRHLAAYLSRQGALVNRRGACQVWVDDHVPLEAGLPAYTLLYLGGQGTFQLNAEKITALYNYLQGGGTVLMENCSPEQGEAEESVETVFRDLLTSFGLKSESVRAGHDLLSSPFLFAELPPGYKTDRPPQILIGQGLIYSNQDYGSLWGGTQRGRTPSRESIRAAMELGGNILAYALKRAQNHA